ncbi:MAG: RteC domain-containing protein [Flavobacterium sp.]|uniref:RteC domain-containing protein n=1 Tax=Flavobacterium sp. TaxID=239 RepID=UPI002FCADA01
MNVKLLERVTELTKDMEVFEYVNPGLQQQLNEKILQIENGITEMNGFIRNYRFKSVHEEIVYFKEIKPQLVMEYVYLSSLKSFYEKYQDLEIKQSKPYKKEVHRLLYFIRDEKDFYGYIKKTHTHNDEHYFRRLSDSHAPRTLYSLNADLESSCSHGLLLAKITAYEKLVAFYTRQLNRLKAPLPTEQVKETLPLEWKANKVDAVELVYALYYSGAVDTDKCTVHELAKQFGELFQIQITEQLYREYIDIKRRKLELARFLVKLLNHFRNRVEEEYT